MTSIGKHARDLLAHDQPATVAGVTSKGAFLRFDANHVVFISDEHFRGPLTLNVNADSGWLNLSRPGDALEVYSGRIRFDHGVYILDYLPAVTWIAPEISTAARPYEERIAILENVATHIFSARAETGLTPWLVNLFGSLDPLHTETSYDTVSMSLQRLRQTLQIGEVDAALAAAGTLLGLGSGLTPSGDDLLLGSLLAFNRWGPRMHIQFDIQRFNQGTMELALRRTTTLSANLLECAANGQADERLVAALDGLLTGQISPDNCASHLIAWGSSSGCDAFVGMALAVQILSSTPLRSH